MICFECERLFVADDRIFDMACCTQGLAQVVVEFRVTGCQGCCAPEMFKRVSDAA